MASNMVLNSTAVSVESLTEYPIEEINHDGMEVYIPPLSMSENLARTAERINFLGEEETSKKNDKDEAITFGQQAWPLSNVHKRLRLAYTEMSVLLDVLQVVREKKYMLIDQTGMEQISYDQKSNGAQLLSKKESLAAASAIIVQGANRMKRLLEERNSQRSSVVTDFHAELLLLRQRWRVRRKAFEQYQTIIGELGFRVGALRPQVGGTFEVRKVDLEEGRTTRSSTLEVILPSDLKGTASISAKIECSRDLMKVLNGRCNPFRPIEKSPPWQVQLERAQSIFQLKGLFAHLSQEALHSEGRLVPHQVLENRIICQLFPHVCLVLELHVDRNEIEGNPAVDEPAVERNLLTYTLEALLAHYQRKMVQGSIGLHPATAPLLMSERRRKAGPLCVSREELLDMVENESRSLLDQAIDIAKHMYLRKRVVTVIDEVTQHVKELHVICNAQSWSTAMMSTLRIMLTPNGYDALYRNLLLVKIGTDDVEVTCKNEMKTVRFQPDLTDFANFLKNQVNQVRVMGASVFTRLLNWTLLSSLTTYDSHLQEQVATVLLGSPDHKRVVSISACPSREPVVFVQRWSGEETASSHSALVTNLQWQLLGGQFNRCDLSAVCGRTFLHQLELVLCGLMAETGSELVHNGHS